MSLEMANHRVRFQIPDGSSAEELYKMAHTALRALCPEDTSFTDFLDHLARLVREERVAKSVATYARRPKNGGPPKSGRSDREKAVSPKGPAPNIENYARAVRDVLNAYLTAVRGGIYKNKAIGLHVNRSGNPARETQSNKSSPQKSTEAQSAQLEIKRLVDKEGLTDSAARAQVIRKLDLEIRELEGNSDISCESEKSRSYIAKVWCRARLQGVNELLSAFEPIASLEDTDLLASGQSELLAAFVEAIRLYRSIGSVRGSAPTPDSPLKKYEHILRRLIPMMHKRAKKIGKAGQGRNPEEGVLTGIRG